MSSSNPTSTECCICLEPMNIKTKNMTLICGHTYHDKCITDYAYISHDKDKKINCPQCTVKAPVDVSGCDCNDCTGFVDNESYSDNSDYECDCPNCQR